MFEETLAALPTNLLKLSFFYLLKEFCGALDMMFSKFFSLKRIAISAGTSSLSACFSLV